MSLADDQLTKDQMMVENKKVWVASVKYCWSNCRNTPFLLF